MADLKNWIEGPATGEDKIKIGANTHMTTLKNSKKTLKEAYRGTKASLIIETGNNQEIKAYPGGRRELEEATKISAADTDRGN